MRFFTFILAMCFVTTVHAQSAGIALSGLSVNPNAPVETSADMLEFDQATGTAIFKGNVVIIQDSMRLKADLVELLRSDAGELSRMLARGNVLLATETEQGEAQEADYDIKNGILIMTGDAMMSQGQNTFLADRIKVDLDAGTAALNGNVRTVLNARPKQ